MIVVVFIIIDHSYAVGSTSEVMCTAATVYSRTIDGRLGIMCDIGVYGHAIDDIPEIMCIVVVVYGRAIGDIPDIAY